MHTMIEFKNLPLGQRLFRAAALTILTGSTLYCGFLTYGYITDDPYAGWNGVILVASVALAGFACLAMTADAYDYLMRGRHFALEDVSKLQMITLVVLGVAFAASAFVVGPKLFVTLAPAVVVYILLVVKPTNVEAQEAMKGRPRKPAPASRGRTAARPVANRQRRGGRKR